MGSAGIDGAKALFAYDILKSWVDGESAPSEIDLFTWMTHSISLLTAIAIQRNHPELDLSMEDIDIDSQFGEEATRFIGAVSTVLETTVKFNRDAAINLLKIIEFNSMIYEDVGMN